MFSTARPCISAVLVDTICCAPSFLLCVIAASISTIASLAPTLAELENVLTWLQLQDANPDWPEHVRNTIADVAKRISHDV